MLTPIATEVPSVVKVIFKTPVTLTSKSRMFGEEATYVYILGVTRPPSHEANALSMSYREIASEMNYVNFNNSCSTKKELQLKKMNDGMSCDSLCQYDELNRCILHPDAFSKMKLIFLNFTFYFLICRNSKSLRRTYYIYLDQH